MPQWGGDSRRVELDSGPRAIGSPCRAEYILNVTLLDFWPAILGAVVIAAVGLIRRDRFYLIAMMTGGYVLVMIALLWSWELGQDATTAIFLAGIGATLATMGTERSRYAKRDKTHPANEPLGRTSQWRNRNE